MQSLRRKFLFAALLAHAVVAAAMLLAMNRLMEHALQTQVVQSAARSRALLAVALEPLLIARDFAAAEELLSMLVQQGSFVYAQLVGRDGRVLVAVGPVPSPPAPPHQPATARWWELPEWHALYHFDAGLRAGGQELGTVRFAIPGRDVQLAQRELVVQLLAVGLVGLALAGAIQLALSRRLTRRLEALAKAADRVAAGENGLHLDESGSDESARLAQTFNRMSAALEQRFQALQESERRQRELTEALAEGVVFQDDQNRVLSCNAAAERILGLAREQLLGAATVDPHRSAIRADGTPFDAGEHPSLQALRSGRPVRNVLMGVSRADGSRAWVSVSSQPLFAPGAERPHATVTSFNDITARIDAERELERANTALESRVQERTAELVRARDVAERANRAKNDFLSRMSHELRTPLNAILGFTQLLRLKAGSPEVDAHLRHVETAGWHLLDLINDVLDLSRIEGGSLVVSVEDVEWAPVVEASVAMAEAAARERRVTIAWQREAVQGAFVRADATRLRQVLVNLLSNACKYNRDGGQVTIGLERDGPWVLLHVVDSGLGMTPEQLGALFEPFNRLGAETSGVAGTGIGLVITRRLVELMGGALEVASRPGEGSRFTVRLPAGTRQGDASASATLPAAAASGAAPPQRRLLYVEDNPSNVILLEELLRLRRDIVLDVATDGDEGLRKALSQPPDLLVIDISLPGMDGLALCRRLRALPHFSRVPIVALSANAMPADRQRADEAGFDRYFTKPLDIAEFVQWLGGALEGRR